MEQKKVIPLDFAKEMAEVLGAEQYAEFEKALISEPSVSIRRNPLKSKSIEEAFGIDDVKFGKPVSWSDYGYYLEERPQFTADPLLHAGCYYVQEASSMFVEEAVRQLIDSPVCALDLCAAPGGKSAALLSVLPEGSLLVSNEIMRQRSQVLAENLTKIGAPGIIVCNNEAKDFQPVGSMFDLIVTDVPCSGEGMFRKDDEAIEDWSLANVKMCAERQRDILTDIWPCLKPEGILIYSTCTFNIEEDERNVEWIANELGAEVIELRRNNEWGIIGNLDEKPYSVAHFMPHMTQGEGFFIAALRKTGDSFRMPSKSTRKKEKGKKDQRTLQIPQESKKYINSSDKYSFIWQNNSLIAFPNKYKEEFNIISESCRIICAGIAIGTIKGRDFIPAHSLAMSTEINKKAFHNEELTYRQAIDYLRKEAITLPSNTPKGYVLLTFKGHPIGFCKNIGNRANNLYPSEWRIRKQI